MSSQDDQYLLIPHGATIRVDEDPQTRQTRVAFTEGRANETSDGYHTFDDLYEHRLALTLALVKSLPDLSWKSKQHDPTNDEMFDGFFIVGIDLPTGTITYHYKLDHWDQFVHAREVEHAPAWDGHTPKGALDRLIKYGGSK